MQKKHGRKLHGKYKFKAMLRIRMYFMRILIQAKISMLIRIQLQQAQLIEKCKDLFINIALNYQNNIFSSDQHQINFVLDANM